MSLGNEYASLHGIRSVRLAPINRGLQDKVTTLAFNFHASQTLSHRTRAILQFYSKQIAPTFPSDVFGVFLKHCITLGNLPSVPPAKPTWKDPSGLYCTDTALSIEEDEQHTDLNS